MPVNRQLWHRLVPRNYIPGYPCPHCENGKLKPYGELSCITPRYQENYKNSDDWDPYFDVERWSVTLCCDEDPCGEIVILSGDSEVVDVEIDGTDGSGWGVENLLRIQSVFPAPRFFRISDNVPRRVKRHLDLAFGIYWIDTSSCIGRLRTALEAILDDQGVPKERLIQKNGKTHRMNLSERIDSFTQGIVHKEHLQGLRNIGNIGTHGLDNVMDDELFDAFDVLEFTLSGIYDTQTIKAKAKRLSEKKA